LQFRSLAPEEFQCQVKEIVASMKVEDEKESWREKPAREAKQKAGKHLHMVVSRVVIVASLNGITR
jgi:hypothetical protein